jgi:hypothetical protein
MLACTGHSVSRQNLRWRCATTLAAPMRPRSSICPSRISSNGSSWQAARPRLSLRRVMDPAFRRRPSTPLPIDAFSPLSPSWRSRYHVAVHDHAVETAPSRTTLDSDAIDEPSDVFGPFDVAQPRATSKRYWGRAGCARGTIFFWSSSLRTADQKSNWSFLHLGVRRFHGHRPLADSVS